MNAHNNLFEVSDQDFAQQVLQSPLPVIVDFSAEWCPPCRALAPVYEKLSDEYEGKLRFASIDIDANPLVPARLGVMAFPTLLVFAAGKPIARLVGPRPARLRQHIDAVLADLALAATSALCIV